MHKLFACITLPDIISLDIVLCTGCPQKNPLSIFKDQLDDLFDYSKQTYKSYNRYKYE